MFHVQVPVNGRTYLVKMFTNPKGVRVGEAVVSAGQGVPDSVQWHQPDNGGTITLDSQRAVAIAEEDTSYR